MGTKNKPDAKGFVYSTDPNFRFENESNSAETLPAAQQKLKIQLNTRYRAGKAVTVVTGYIGNENDMEELGKKLKTYCGTGGSAKDGEIFVQGDQRNKVLQYLQQNGYKLTKII
jgi:translation initiation factor 1